MQSIIDMQDEKDKNSISLVGVKESIADPNNHIKKQGVVSLDNKCVNCSNNPQASDRAIIIQQFKMACLQYKPSCVIFNNREYSRDNILELKQKMITELDNL